MSLQIAEIYTGAHELLNSREILEMLAAAILGGMFGGLAFNILDNASTFSKRMGERMDIRESKHRKPGNFN